jgi:hypothetical protein
VVKGQREKIRCGESTPLSDETEVDKTLTKKSGSHTENRPANHIQCYRTFLAFLARVTHKETAARRMPSSGTLRRVALVRTDVSEELSASIIRATTIGELGTLAATSNRIPISS